MSLRTLPQTPILIHRRRLPSGTPLRFPPQAHGAPPQPATPAPSASTHSRHLPCSHRHCHCSPAPPCCHHLPVVRGYQTPARHRRFLSQPPLSALFRPPQVEKFAPLARQMERAISAIESPVGMDETVEEEYAAQAKLLREFSNISNIEKAWVFKSKSASGGTSQAMFSIGQGNLLSNTKRMMILSSHVSKGMDGSVNFDWSPFPIELQGASAVVPSPSGSKLLVVRNDSPTRLELWGRSMLQKEIHVPNSVHGSIFSDGWFEGISWNREETFIAYVAEEPCPKRPAFDNSGIKKDASTDNECGSWKGQGEFEEHWGETYSEKKRPALFVLNIESGEVRAVGGISKSLSVGQVVWAPSSSENDQSLVFVGWTPENGPFQFSRKLGMKYCYNRPCSLFLVKSPFQERASDEIHDKRNNATEDLEDAVNLTPSLSSAFFPRFSPDGTSLVFLSAKSAVDSGVHSATDSLHRIDWIVGGGPSPSSHLLDVVPVVMCADDGCFPGLYCSSIMSHPWLSDGHTMILCSYWGSAQVILSVNISSGIVKRVTPSSSKSSWSALALDGDSIIAVFSNPVEPPKVSYGNSLCNKDWGTSEFAWEWLEVASPFSEYPEKVKSLLSLLTFDILKIPIEDEPENLNEGSKKTFEAIFVTSNVPGESKKEESGSKHLNPSIVVIHGGPHSVSLASYSTSLAFLASLGYNLLIVNYRGSLGFGEEALQSLPGKIGSQDVSDILTAMDYATKIGLLDPLRVAVLGGSHGGFLATHLIGQAPDRFKVAVARNPVCNLSLMVGTTDIPDWCYVEAYGLEWKELFTEAPSAEHLQHFISKSPIAHLSKVRVPILFLLGAQDLRVPVSNGLQYARSLKARGGVVKVIVFPNDVHGIERPQSDFESFLNIGVWFRKHCS